MNLTEKIISDVKADKFEMAVDQEVKDLMENGAEFYPFKWQNVREATGELSSTDWIVFSSWLHVSYAYQERKKQENHAGAMAAFELQEMIIAYWTKEAREQAEKNVNRRM